jgi:hypothetical protein
MNKVCRELGLPTEIINVIGDYNGTAEQDIRSTKRIINIIIRKATTIPEDVICTVIKACSEWQSTIGAPVGGWAAQEDALIQFGMAVYETYSPLSPLLTDPTEMSMEVRRRERNWYIIGRRLAEAGLNRLMLNDIMSRLRWRAVEAHRKRRSC